MEKPTTDCEGCNQCSTYEDGTFHCKWYTPKPIEITEDRRCYGVLMMNKLYDEAVERGKRLKEEERRKNENNI